MTDTERDTDGKPSLEIVRDTTFVRFTADEALVSGLGRDVEVGFIQYGPLYRRQFDMGDEEATEAKSVLTEVARMRMSYASMVNFAMSFLREGIEGGRLKRDAIMNSLSSWHPIEGDDGEVE